MATLVFDIESVPIPLEEFDESRREYLLREAERLPDEVSRGERCQEIRRQMALWPLTARVACIAMLNVDSGGGQVLHLSGTGQVPAGEAEGPVSFVPLTDERDLLGSFWRAVQRFDRIVTFNGRAFDVPFLYLRSAVLAVPITRMDWLGYRFQTEPHCDLAEQLSFYGVSGREGAARRFNLDFYCRAFGIESPKSHGVTGMDVGRLMEEGRHREVAEYCLRDVQATVELYRIWKDRLAGIR